MAEFPCAAMRRRLFDPPKSIHLFIEKPRENIDIYRYFQKFLILERGDALRNHTRARLESDDGKCGVKSD